MANHTYISIQGKRKLALAQCVRCKVIREKIGIGWVYYKDGETLNYSPKCIPLQNEKTN